MNLDQLKQELAEDEGCKYEIYLDHLGLPTVGIGHLITEDDPEAQLSVGTPVSEERVNMLFRRDIAVTVEDCHRLYDDFKDLPEEAQLIIANMMFNLGYPRLSKFARVAKVKHHVRNDKLTLFWQVVPVFVKSVAVFKCDSDVKLKHIINSFLLNDSAYW